MDDFGNICSLDSNPVQLDTPLVLIDRNNRNSSQLTCADSGDKKCTVLNEFTLKSESDYFSLVPVSHQEYYIEKNLKLTKNFDFESNYFYNIEFNGKNEVFNEDKIQSIELYCRVLIEVLVVNLLRILREKQLQQ